MAEQMVLQAENVVLQGRIRQLEMELNIANRVGEAHQEWAHRATARVHRLLKTIDDCEREDQ
jgi:hypothetical protein